MVSTAWPGTVKTSAWCNPSRNDVTAGGGQTRPLLHTPQESGISDPLYP